MYMKKYNEMRSTPEYKTFQFADKQIKELDRLRKTNPERYERKLKLFIDDMHKNRRWILKYSTNRTVTYIPLQYETKKISQKNRR